MECYIVLCNIGTFYFWIGCSVNTLGIPLNGPLSKNKYFSVFFIAWCPDLASKYDGTLLVMTRSELLVQFGLFTGRLLIRIQSPFLPKQFTKHTTSYLIVSKIIENMYWRSGDGLSVPTRRRSGFAGSSLAQQTSQSKPFQQQAR